MEKFYFSYAYAYACMELFHRIFGFFEKENCHAWNFKEKLLDVVYFNKQDSNMHIVIVWWPLCLA